MRVCASLDKTPGKSVRRNTEKGIETDKQGRLDSVAYRGGIWGVQTPPEILKALQNCSKLNPIVKTVKKCWIQDANTPTCSEKKGSKIL